MSVPSVTRSDVEVARERLDEVVVRTPLQYCERWSTALGATVLLKREDQQPVRSYKIRGALNVISQLSETERAAGVVAASAGNHAQGVALACADLGVHARIYLPTNTPRQKRDRVAAFGKGFVELVVGGESYDDAAAAAKLDAERTGATLVPAFDNPQVVAGQGTVMAEVVDELKGAPDVVLVPVGGGGLLAGTIAALGDSPTRIIGVEPAGAASLVAALAAGAPVTLDELDAFADGTAVRRIGDVTFPIIAAASPEVVTVDEGALCVEMLALYQTEGIIAEPSGALASAALAQLEVEPGQTVVVVVSGGNNDVSRYADVVERALVYEGRKHYFMVEFSQEPGALRRFLDDVLGPDDDISLFEYVKRNNREFGPALVGIELGSAEDYEPLLKRMDASPLRIEHLPPDSPLFGFVL
ncbi:L-threonine ammonia-lyase [Yimella lutea]|uniref:L-threonine dehydratase n=1 Tax=Yimella lutea TaxID=587872 RepID=A0A542ECK8_9MICO|nr:threonine ammonia-lyase IlvA [Yimella lutea]TQJ13034.1 L-threonine ammonia-lyase [Yimella lutea]